jgi:hypothetical protein
MYGAYLCCTESALAEIRVFDVISERIDPGLADFLSLLCTVE